MQMLNFCRLYLQITFISELVSATGTHLIPQFWTGHLTDRQSHPLSLFPRQAKPSESVWTLWRASIRKVFCHPRSTRLRTSLGSWLTCTHGRYYSVTANPPTLWNCSGVPKFHRQVSDLSTTFYSASTSGHPSVDSCPVDILPHNRTIHVSAHSNMPSISISSPTTSEHTLGSLHPWQL